MRRLLVLISASALISATVASAASASSFGGSSMAPYPGGLRVSFTELGVGSHPVGYRLDAEARWQTGVRDDGTPIIQAMIPSLQIETIVPERGRASGELTPIITILPGGSPACPAPERNPDGTYPESEPCPPTSLPMFLGWFDITVTSSTGRVLRLPDLLPATTSG
jgi:hypothetical protein